MKNNIKKIASVADFLDKKGEVKIASTLDSLNKNILKIVTAQYVGAQGYWIRNTRCWNNCYRQKRAENSGKPAQEVWNDCYKEYSESINNNESGWEKYAEETNTNIKIASKDVKEKNIKIAKLIKEKIDNKMPIPVAVFSTFDDMKNQYTEACINTSNDLIKVATVLKDKGLVKSSKILISAAEDMLKEAGMWDKVKGFFSSNVKNLNKLKEFIKKLIEQGKNVLQQEAQAPKATQPSSGGQKPQEKPINTLKPMPEAKATVQPVQTANASSKIQVFAATKQQDFFTKITRTPEFIQFAEQAGKDPNSEFSKYFQNFYKLLSQWSNTATTNFPEAINNLQNISYQFLAQIPQETQQESAQEQEMAQGQTAKSFSPENVSKAINSSIDRVYNGVPDDKRNSIKQRVNDKVLQNPEVQKAMQVGDRKPIDKAFNEIRAEINKEMHGTPQENISVDSLLKKEGLQEEEITKVKKYIQQVISERQSAAMWNKAEENAQFAASSDKTVKVS